MAMGVLLARGPRARVRQGRAGTTMVVIVPNCDFGDLEIWCLDYFVKIKIFVKIKEVRRQDQVEQGRHTIQCHGWG